MSRAAGLALAATLAAASASPQDHLAHADHAAREGLFGPYAHTREASGTAWQPEATPMGGRHGTWGSFEWMLHGFAQLALSSEGGPRGDTEVYGTHMLMGGLSRPLGPGRLGLKAMLSLEPLMGPEGYPLLLQTGETADGRNNLFDRQHPHDLVMELAASYSVSLGDDASTFVYFGLPGEPALGPAAFLHRRSGERVPVAPIAHHWLDSTHVTYGVATLGLAAKGLKLDASVFTGAEPDEKRWSFERPRFDSLALRLTANPSRAWSVQASAGWLEEPEQVHPGVDTLRLTASVSHAARLGGGLRLDTTLAWGRNERDADIAPNRFDRFPPSRVQHAFLLESTLELRGHTLALRAERAGKDELFPLAHPFHGRVFPVTRLSLTYLAEGLGPLPSFLGLGAAVATQLVPDELELAYGPRANSLQVFGRLVVP